MGLSVSNTLKLKDQTSPTLRNMGRSAEEFGKKGQAGGKAASSGINKVKESAKGANLSIINLNQGLELLKKIGSAMRGVMDFSDEMASTQARIKSIVREGENWNDINKMIQNTAMDVGASYLDIADFVAKTGQQAGEAFGSTEEVVAFTELLYKAGAASGALGDSFNAAMRQLNQGLSSGTLRGDELVSVLEQAPEITRLISQYLGVNIAEMRNMASQGLITSEVVKNAMFGAADEINSKFAEMPMTFGRTMENMKNVAVMAVQPILDTISGFLNNPAVQNIIPVLANTINIVIDSVLPAVQQFIDILAGILSNPAIMAALDLIGQLFALLGQSLTTIIPPIMNIVDMLMAVVFPIILMLIDIVNMLLPPVMQLIEALFQLLQPILMLIPILLEALMPIFVMITDVVNMLIPPLLKLIEPLTGIINMLLGYFIPILEIMMSIYQALMPLLQTVVDLLDLLAPILDLIRIVLTPLLDLLQAVLVPILNVIKTVIEAVVGAIRTFISWLQTLIGWLLGKVNEVATETGDNSAPIGAAAAGAKAVTQSYISSKYQYDPSKYAATAPVLTGNNFDFSKMGGGAGGVGIPDGTAGKPVNTKVKNDVSIKDEDLKYIRDSARIKFINQYTTLRPSVQATFGDVRESADVNKILNYIADAVDQANVAALA